MEKTGPSVFAASFLPICPSAEDGCTVEASPSDLAEAPVRLLVLKLLLQLKVPGEDDGADELHAEDGHEEEEEARVDVRRDGAFHFLPSADPAVRFHSLG